MKLSILTLGLFISGAAYANPNYIECSKLKLQNVYTCNMEDFGNVDLEIKQDKNQFEVNFIFEDGAVEGDVYIADDKLRKYSDPQRADTYMGFCTKNTLIIEHSLQTKETGKTEIKKTSNGVQYTQTELDLDGSPISGLRIQCKKK